MTLAAKSEINFADSEWHRLDSLSNRFDSALKQVHTRVIVLGKGSLTYTKGLVKETIADFVAETAVSTAHVYGLNFQPSSPAYGKMVNELTNNFMKVVRNDEAKSQVQAVLPSGLSLPDRNNRLDVFGLSGRDAVRIEHMRQNGVSGKSLADARQNLQLRRGNLIALTEVNRIINQTIETVWLENMIVSKARKSKDTSQMLLEHGGTVTAITSLRGIPATAEKQIVTRRDNRTCDYCLPLDGTVARIGERFYTRYGVFLHPPFHPRCRCVMIMRY